MNEIPIFDSLTHPMPEGGWLSEKYEGLNTVDSLLEEMQESNIKWAFAVGMGESIGGYQEKTYVSYIRENSDFLLPVAFVNFEKIPRKSSVYKYLLGLSDLGYVGIKIHPRLAGINYSHPALAEVIAVARQLDLVVLLCTYYWECSKESTLNGLDGLMSLLSEIPDEKLVLLHGSAVRLLEAAEIARAFKNVILDLSATILKYQGSSIDLDIQYLFKNFDQRICIGSDSPEFRLSELRARFNEFSKDLSVEKVTNIANQNLLSLVGSKAAS